MIRITTDKAIEAMRAKAAEEERRRADLDERLMHLNCRINELETQVFDRLYNIDRKLESNPIPTNTPIAPAYPGWKQPCTNSTSWNQEVTMVGGEK